MKKITDLKTRNDFADFFDIPRKKLTYLLYIKGVENYYTSFEIPKKSGGYRTINAPQGFLKNIQHKLAQALYAYAEIGKGERCKISHGFEKKKSIISNAEVHKNKRYILNLDLKDFFDTFHFGRVRGFFNKDKDFAFSIEVSTLIAQLTCLRGVLPQGAPTSPVITNLICRILDFRILKIAKKYKLVYTRYADDLTFSTNDKHFLAHQKEFLNNITEEVVRAGFQINQKKTRLMYKDSQQIVTGLVTNKKVNVSQKYYRLTRAMAFSLYKTGKFTIDSKQGTLAQLEGRFSFIDRIIKHNNKNDGCSHKFHKLSGREKEISRFLFYKHFYQIDMPLIITEGKTDIRYLKAALKNLFLSYPTLISKAADDEFKFNISFFKRKKRFHHFLNISQDGADSLINIYNLFTYSSKSAESSLYNHYAFLSKISAEKKRPPTILLFDNELNSNGKPLKKFISQIKLSNHCKTFLENNCYCLLDQKSNLYLATNPLIPGKTECEIEELFPDNVLNHTINGKTFGLKNFDSEKNYSKDRFSQYILKNYEKIDFDNFRPLLNAISTIIKNTNS